MIVSDATILITLIEIDEFRVLELFVDHIYITDEVYHEVSYKIYAKKFLDKKIEAGFISKEDPKDKKLLKEINFILDLGESSAIVLALQKKVPIIIDEKKARRFAKSKGLEVIGLVGILKFLYLEKKLTKEEVMIVIDKLNSSSFKVTKKLLDMIFL